MRYVNLGNSTIKVSVICFGAWAIGGKWWGGTDKKDSVNAIEASLSTGVNFIDTAPAYGQGLSEELVAKAIKGKRDKVVLATKCGLRWNLDKDDHFFEYFPGVSIYRYLGKESIRYEIEESLRRLNTDYIDLIQTHWQDLQHQFETMEALMELKEKGIIRAIGASNASASQLNEYSKKLNSTLVDETATIYDEINMGLAVAGEKGLIVPVIFNTDKLSIISIAKKRIELIDKIKKNTISIDEISGGTFTVSNLGMYRVRSFTAIINPPQTVILTIGEIYKNLVMDEEKNIKQEYLMNLSAAVDHRIIDGYDGAKYMQTLLSYLENPYFIY